MQKIKDKGKLVVGTKYDQPLFGLLSTSTNKPEGFDVEIAKLVAQAIFGPGGEGKIEFVESVSKNREPFLQAGQVDIVVATYTITDKRKEVIDFSKTYYTAGQDIMVKKEDTSVKSATDLNGKKVCSAKGSTSEKNVRDKAPTADLLLFDTYSECADALGDGRVQAVSTDNVILLGLVSKNDKFKVVNNPFTSEPYGIGTAKSHPEFTTFINDVLDKSFKDGSWKKAYDSTVGKVPGAPAAEPPKS
jgi:glutamate transport system substrate-binding protein